MNLFTLLVIALITEAVWETAKMFWQNGKVNGDRVGAVVLGVFVCIAAGVDFFVMVDVPLTVPYAGAVLSGLLVSRGSNFLHDLYVTVDGLRK